MEPTRVLVAGRHPILRVGLRWLLEREPGVAVVGEAGSGEEVLRLTERAAVHALVLGGEVSGLSTVELLRRLRSRKASVRVVVLSDWHGTDSVLDALEAGAAACLWIGEEPDSIVEAVRRVARGEEGWLSRSLAEKVAALLASGGGRPGVLSRRQLEVLQLVIAGNTNGAIAVELGISAKTVEKHLRAIFATLGVSSRTEAAVRVVRQRLL